MTIINVGKHACDQIEIICFGVDIIAKRKICSMNRKFFLNGWKFKVRINIKRLSVIYTCSLELIGHKKHVNL